MLCFRLIQRKLFTTPQLASELPIANNKSRNDIQIVVIGGGLAGLSAASHLLQHGFRNTIILEAKDRYGGRINSKRFGDVFCELGARWITVDASKDSTYELLQQTTGLNKKLLQQQQQYYVNTFGQKINRKVPAIIETIFKRLCTGIEIHQKYKNHCGNLPDLNNVHTYFQAEANTVIETMFKKNERALAGDIFNSLFCEFGSLLGCCLEYVNIEHIIKEDNPNKSPIFIPSGLDNILNQITKDIDKQHMKMGKPVGEIKWYLNSKQGKRSVGCLDGTLFPADHIICTLPLGVLKNFSRYMFKPLLPKEKLKAIQNLGFGSPTKIYFEYKKNVNAWFTSNIRPLWSEYERKKNPKWTKQVVEISQLSDSKRVLEILIGGAFYDEIEKLPDTEVENEVTKILRICLKNPKIPPPNSILRSNWSSCPCYLGGRPYLSVNSTVNDVVTLAAPLGDTPSLLFAGDATILHGFGTIDGARKSGIREARRIVEYYNRLS